MIVSFDTETHLMKFGYNSEGKVVCGHMLAPKPVCGTFFDGTDAQLYSSEGAAGALGRLILKNSTIVGHNVAYDMGVLAQSFPWLLERTFDAYESGHVKDTKVRQQLLDIRDGDLGFKGLSLADLSDRLLGKKLEKEDTYRLRYAELDGKGIKEWPAEAAAYALNDAITTRQVYQVQGMEDLGNEDHQTRAAWALHLMSIHGMRTDPERVKVLGDHLNMEHTELERALKSSPYVRFERGKMKKNMKPIYAAMEKAYGITVDRTDTGRPCVDEEAYLNSGDPDLILIGQSMKSEKLRTTYLPVLEFGVKYPICANYNVLVETGRTSCSKPNLQNPPRKYGIRECFIPRPGFVFCAVDYDTAELRSLAQLCYSWTGKSAMREALIQGQDLHLNLVAAMMRKPYNEILASYRAGDSNVEEMRQFAKCANFGFPGGLIAPSFVDYARTMAGIEVKLSEAERLRDGWLAAYPEMHEYFNVVMQMFLSRKKVITHLFSGRKRRVKKITQAYNSPFQGLTADGAKEALFRLAKACYLAEPSHTLYRARPVAFLHDEIIVEVPETMASECAKKISQIMTESMSAWIPDVPITCGPVLMRRWYKGAKAVYVDDELVPSKLGEKGKWIADV